MPSTHPRRQEVAAQTAVSQADWLAIVKTHHAAIAKTFDELLSTDTSRSSFSC